MSPFSSRHFLREILALLLLCLLGTSGAFASEFEEGNRLFHAGKFADAEQAYRRSLAKDGDSAATHHNLGKVREALADPSGAMLEWERALRLEPGHIQAREALQLSRNNFGSKVEKTPWWLKLQPSFTRNRERWLLALCAWIAVLAGFVALFQPRSRHVSTGLALFAVLATCVSGAWLWRALEEANVAVIRDRSVTLRSAPADPARSVDALPLGSRVSILDASGGWSRVKIAGGETGWIPAQSLERVSPAQER